MRQLEAEADAIIQMVREGQRARRLQQGPPPTVSTASAAVVAGSAVAAPHAPTGVATTAAAATVSMSCTDRRHHFIYTFPIFTVGRPFDQSTGKENSIFKLISKLLSWSAM